MTATQQEKGATFLAVKTWGNKEWGWKVISWTEQGTQNPSSCSPSGPFPSVSSYVLEPLYKREVFRCDENWLEGAEIPHASCPHTWALASIISLSSEWWLYSWSPSISDTKSPHFTVGFTYGVHPVVWDQYFIKCPLFDNVQNSFPTLRIFCTISPSP